MKDEENKLNISICSYNVFWQIMKNNSSPLENKLGKKKIDGLKSNLLKNIFHIKNYYNPFIYCFQEAENPQSIIEIFSDSNYSYHIGYSEPEHILTIWNNQIMKKKFIIDGEFEPGRPFTILILKDLRFSKYFILINIHAGHNHDTKESIFEPIQKTINKNTQYINKFNIERIVIVGDFNRDIGSQITLEPNKFFVHINLEKYYFVPFITKNKTCCNLKGYAYNKNYDQLIDSYSEPILIHQLNKESWYIPESSDHLMILSIIKNFI